MIVVQDEDSCRRSGQCETPQERMRRGGSRATRGKRSLARKSLAVFRDYSKMPSLGSGFIFSLSLFHKKRISVK
ncbi:hypothetical protein AAEO50_19960 [Rossellomorea oryzaecorticis]|uniref:Uncharacterized protein n=1 Tax=Rossellomorea oryzaecorticis TaxID=1396505 RepID=A0ABU9KIB4_9BACI